MVIDTDFRRPRLVKLNLFIHLSPKNLIVKRTRLFRQVDFVKIINLYEGAI